MIVITSRLVYCHRRFWIIYTRIIGLVLFLVLLSLAVIYRRLGLDSYLFIFLFWFYFSYSCFFSSRRLFACFLTWTGNSINIDFRGKALKQNKSEHDTERTGTYLETPRKLCNVCIPWCKHQGTLIEKMKRKEDFCYKCIHATAHIYAFSYRYIYWLLHPLT